MQALQPQETDIHETDVPPVSQLPSELEECHALINDLRTALLAQDETLKKKDFDLTRLKSQLQDLLRNKYGRKSEKVSPDQLLLFAEAVLEQLDREEAAEKSGEGTSAKGKKKHGGGGRNPLFDELDTVTRDYHPESVVCQCSALMTEFGSETTDQLDFVPANFKRIRHVVHKYSCPKCHKGVAEGRKPEQVHSGGIPTEGVLAQLSVAKYADHLPLYRQHQMYQRQGVSIALSTMGRWMEMSAQSLRRIYDRMCELILKSKSIQADETPLDFIDKSRPVKKIKQGYFWTYFGDDAHPYVLFDFKKDRCGKNPEEFLENYEGFLLTDGYSGYEWFCNSRSANCHVHCRRNFEKATKANAKDANFALAIYRRLYEIEDRIRVLSEAEIVQVRQRESVPLLNQLHDWLLEKQKTALPKTPMGTAINYALNRWDKLMRYTCHGFLQMDTNLVENAIRPTAIGRKNFMFLGSEHSGEAASIHASLVNTCKRLGVNPFDYLRDVLIRLGRNPDCDIDELLPDRWRASIPT